MDAHALACLRAAGRIASAARERGALRIVGGARLRDVCEEVEADIRRQGGGIAFPVQSSRNKIAAHYCASPEDDTVYEDGDLAKLDIGVHVEGWVVDTATTVAVGEHPEGRRLVEAARAALEAGIVVAGAGVTVRRISEAIEGTLRAHGSRPLRNLCGHGVGRWLVHCPPPIPNAADGSPDWLPAGAVVALEPFATDGRGEVREEGPAEVFRLDPRREPANGDPDVLAAIRAFRGLPFARRQLAALPRTAVEETLQRLRAAGQLTAYPPLVEGDGRPVAQAEHTIYVGAVGVEVLTR